MVGVVAVVRPGNVLIAGVAVVVGAVVAVGPGVLWTFSEYSLALALAAAVAALFTAAGNVLNDYFDAETDRVNHPDRPIPRGLLTRKSALRISGTLFGSAVLLSLFLNIECLLLVLANLAAMVSYEVSFKARGGSGNLLIAYLVGSLFLFAGAATWRLPGYPLADESALLRAGVLALLASLATVGREIAKDIEDAAGDVDRRTLPKTLGTRRAGLLASAAFVLAAGLSVLPYLLGILPGVYLVLVLVADAVFIYCALFPTRTERQIGRVAKYGMVVALVAFLAGALR